MDRPSCLPLLQKAASFDLFPVPQNEAELRDAWADEMDGDWLGMDNWEVVG